MKALFNQICWVWLWLKMRTYFDGFYSTAYDSASLDELCTLAFWYATSSSWSVPAWPAAAWWTRFQSHSSWSSSSVYIPLSSSSMPPILQLVRCSQHFFSVNPNLSRPNNEKMLICQSLSNKAFRTGRPKPVARTNKDLRSSLRREQIAHFESQVDWNSSARLRFCSSGEELRRGRLLLLRIVRFFRDFARKQGWNVLEVILCWSVESRS